MSDLDAADAVRPIGESLVSFSRNARSSARGLITALFPYILPASKRMSTRAISAFLLQEHKVSVSAATIAKALREPEKHLSYIGDAVEPAARVVADALGVNLVELLESEVLFLASRTQPPILGGLSDKDLSNEHEDYIQARNFLERGWYSLDGTVRELVIAQIERDAEESEESEEGSADE